MQVKALFHVLSVRKQAIHCAFRWSRTPIPSWSRTAFRAIADTLGEMPEWRPGW